MFRSRVPDKFKRTAILAYFGFDGPTADKNYDVAKAMAGNDFIEITNESLITVKKCGDFANFLSLKGKQEVEFILVHLNK